jgi:hypothetical protein
VIETLADEVLEDLRAGGVAVIGRIRGFSNWRARNQPCFCASSRGLGDHGLATSGGRRENHLRAEHAHDLAALDRKGFDHDGDERVALGRAHHRERDAGVARGRLDDGLSGFSAPLRSASSMMAIARRSLTEDSGLKNSHFTYIVVPAGASRLILTIGVRPMVPKMLS